MALVRDIQVVSLFLGAFVRNVEIVFLGFALVNNVEVVLLSLTLVNNIEVVLLNITFVRDIQVVSLLLRAFVGDIEIILFGITLVRNVEDMFDALRRKITHSVSRIPHSDISLLRRGRGR